MAHPNPKGPAMNYPIGTVVSGTHRTEDLVSAFMGALAHLSPADAVKIRVRYFAILDGVTDELRPEWDRPADNPAYDLACADMTAVLIDELYELLDANAPAGTYFGAHPGDGADFGFWSVTDLYG
jgi:hypothetical protein